MRLRLIRVDLPLKHVFTTFRREVSTVRSLIVELEQDGLRGHGEAYEDLFYGVSVEDMYSQLELCRDKLDHYALADPIAFWSFLEPLLGAFPFARSAIDCAAYDLWGKMKNKPLWKLWGLSRDNLPVSSFSIGIDSLERVSDRMTEVPDWSIYRVKLGSRRDVETLRLIRERTAADFYVDVNGGWTVQRALEMLPLLQELGVKLIEQPLNPLDWEGMTKLKKEMKKKQFDIPVFADESWKTVADLDKCMSVFDGINVKIQKCSGLTPVRDLIAKIRQKGLKVAAANTVESGVGASATAQIASLVDYIGIDGPYQIDKKVGSGVRLDKGVLHYPDEAGTGVRVVFR